MRKSGFSLAEILVTIAIISILAILGATGLRAALSKARATQCISSIRGVGIALHTYAAENDEMLPALITSTTDSQGNTVWTGDMDIRHVVGSTGASVQGMVCPEDVRRRRMDPGSYISYIYLPAGDGLSLDATPNPVPLVLDIGCFHSPIKRTTLFSDNHVEMLRADGKSPENLNSAGCSIPTPKKK